MQVRARRRRGAYGILLVLVALTACSQEHAAGNVAESEPAMDGSGAPATPTSAVAARVIPPSAGSTDAALPGIPSALRGRWGMGRADCDPSTGADKGALVVGADSLRFFESTGKLGTVAMLTPDSIRATFAFSGEGQTWMREQTLTLGRDGRLVRREAPGGDAPGPFAYIRC